MVWMYLWNSSEGNVGGEITNEWQLYVRNNFMFHNISECEVHDKVKNMNVEKSELGKIDEGISQKYVKLASNQIYDALTIDINQ